MKKKRISLDNAVFMLVIGILLGSVFTFGMQHWNKTVDREDCDVVQTRFISHDVITRRLHHIKEISIDCANGNRYFIDGECVTAELRSTLSALPAQEPISLLIHPNSNTILEFTTTHRSLLAFDDAIADLHGEATGFLYLGIFMYACGLVGLYYTVLHSIRKGKKKR